MSFGLGLGTMTPDYLGKAKGLMGDAATTYSKQQKKNEIKKPGPTAGGAILSGASMAAAGFGMLEGTALGGPAGAGIGAVVGLAGYLLS
jgi:hypothetical protein